MCYLLTFAVPADAEEPKGTRQLQITKFNASDSGHTYPSSMRAYSLTSGGCSCDLILEQKDATAVHELRTKREKKYRAKGWSEAKIGRALSANEGGEPRTPLRSDALQLLQGVLERHKQLHLTLHWHTGDFEAESFTPLRTEQVRIERGVVFSEVNENVRYEFMADRA